MNNLSTETPEKILGREPASIEREAIADNFVPNFRIGDKVEGNQQTGNGEVDSFVLFKIPNQGYVWGLRMKGQKDYYPQDFFKKVVTTA